MQRIQKWIAKNVPLMSKQTKLKTTTHHCTLLSGIIRLALRPPDTSASQWHTDYIDSENATHLLSLFVVYFSLICTS